MSKWLNYPDKEYSFNNKTYDVKSEYLKSHEHIKDVSVFNLLILIDELFYKIEQLDSKLK